MAGLNSLSMTSGCTKPKKRKKASSNQTTTIQEMTCRHKQKLHTRCVAFGESNLQSLTRTTWAEVNKIKASMCHSVPVLQCVCMIENVSLCTLLTEYWQKYFGVGRSVFERQQHCGSCVFILHCLIELLLCFILFWFVYYSYHTLPVQGFWSWHGKHFTYDCKYSFVPDFLLRKRKQV